jgi:hypothetical protein
MRTTSALKRINEEFRRRTKTHASLPGHDAQCDCRSVVCFGADHTATLNGYQDVRKGAEKAA